MLKKLLVGVKIDDPSIGVVELTGLTSTEGEAAAYNRKAKLIFFYEWIIKGTWEGHLNGCETKITGKFEIPNVSEENSADDVEVEVSVDESSQTKVGSDALKELVRKKGINEIRSKIAEYVTRLKNDFAKDLIKPTKDQVQASGQQPTKDQVQASDQQETTGNQVKEVSSKLHVNNTPNNNSSRTSSAGVEASGSSKVSNPSSAGFEAKDLTISEELKCKAEEAFRVFVQSELLSAFSRGSVTVHPVVGGTFSMFDGNVSGSFTKIEPNQVIEQTWRFKQWPEGYHSNVTITFEEKSDHTLVTVNQVGIPVSDYDRTEHGWRINYFRSIKQCFGFGALLY